jgi:hypothetical protein
MLPPNFYCCPKKKRHECLEQKSAANNRSNQCDSSSDNLSVPKLNFAHGSTLGRGCGRSRRRSSRRCGRAAAGSVYTQISAHAKDIRSHRHRQLAHCDFWRARAVACSAEVQLATRQFRAAVWNTVFVHEQARSVLVVGTC